MKAIITLLLAGALFAPQMTSASASNTDLKKEILTYPENAKAKKLDGLVLVTFEVDSTGNVNILEMNASHEEFGDYVQDKLGSIQLPGDDQRIGKQFSYKIKYKTK